MILKIIFLMSHYGDFLKFHVKKSTFFAKKESVTVKKRTLAQELLFFYQTYKSRFS